MNRIDTVKLSAIALTLSFVLTGCDSGGGGGSDAPSTPPPPNPPLILSPDLVQLKNSDVTNTVNNDYIRNLTAVPANTQRAFSFTADGSQGIGLYRNSLSIEELNIPTEFITLKNQFRSTWLPTVGNLVVAKSDSSNAFKANFTNYLNLHDELKLNAVIFQVRPQLDAFYPSTINPWSEFLNSGVQGLNIWTDKATFDPLHYMIEETHKRGMEYHAWLNPYRVTNFDFSTNQKVKAKFTSNEITSMSTAEKISALVSVGILAETNFAALNPDLVYEFDEKFYLNPAEEKVITHVVASIEEIIKNYDVDAIQFDDYFYIGDALTSTNYQSAFDFNQSGKTTLAEFEQWRRDNVTLLITSVAEAINSHNQTEIAAVQFGISPAGIWCNKDNCSEGSVTRGAQTYQGTTFADTKLWVENGYIDYIAPQIYWSLDSVAAPYGEISYWWNDIVQNASTNETISNKKTQLYIGHANYKHIDNSAKEVAWQNPAEIPNQLKYNLTLSDIQGSIFYHYNHLNKANSKNNQIVKDSIDILKKDYLYAYTLPPAKPWLDHDGKAPEPLTSPQFVVKSLTQTAFNEIIWTDIPNNDTRYYVIYRGIGAVDSICDNPNNIIKKIWKGTSTNFRESFAPDPNVSQFTYLISSVDAAQQESMCSEVKISETMVLK